LHPKHNQNDILFTGGTQRQTTERSTAGGFQSDQRAKMKAITTLEDTGNQKFLEKAHSTNLHTVVGSDDLTDSD